MAKFIKFTNFLVNTNNIYKIVIKPNKYNIHIITKALSGSGWNIFGFGIGTMASYTSEIEVCETKHSTDYKILSDWIDKQ
jgi:hypothetical protein